jgi:hypothetical protein
MPARSRTQVVSHPVTLLTEISVYTVFRIVPETWFWASIPGGGVAGNFSLHRVQNGSGAHPASYPMGTRGSFPGGKAAGAWSLPLTSIWCRGEECVELYLTPPIRLHGMVLSAKGQLYLYLIRCTEYRQVATMWLFWLCRVTVWRTILVRVEWIWTPLKYGFRSITSVTWT